MVALGITWVLDGLEVTLAGAVAGVLKDRNSLGFTDTEIGLTATFYFVAVGTFIGCTGVPELFLFLQTEHYKIGY